MLLYVVPDPEGVSGERPQAGDDLPPLNSVVWASLVSIPRNETVLTELRDLREHNRRNEEALEARLAVARLDRASFETAARLLFPLYRQVRRDRSIRFIVGEISHGIAEKSGVGLPYHGERERMRRNFGAADLPWLPSALPEEGWQLDPETWDWGQRPLV